MKEDAYFLEEILLGEEYGAYLDEEGNTARLELMGLLNRRQILRGVRAGLKKELKDLQQEQSRALRDGRVMRQRDEWYKRQERIDTVRERIEMTNDNLKSLEVRIAEAKVRVIDTLAAMLCRVIEVNTRRLRDKKRECHENLAAGNLQEMADEFTALREVRDYLFGLYERLQLYHSLSPIKLVDMNLFSPLPEFEHWGDSYRLSLEMARDEIG